MTTIVIITWNRCDELLAVLARLRALPEQPPVIVVDNGSTDGTVELVGRLEPWVTVVALERNVGAAGRTIGAALARTPYVAFCDDDSWWAPGAIARAQALLDRHPRCALLAGRVLVGPGGEPDPICALMADSPLGVAPDLPGPSVLGFLACAAIVRREAFLAVGGFGPQLGVGGEETLLAVDLASAGWGLAYVAEIVAHHHPSPVRDPARRRRQMVRNELWTAWLRASPGVAMRRTATVVARAIAGDRASGAGLLEALGGMRWALAHRRPAPAPVAQENTAPAHSTAC